MPKKTDNQLFKMTLRDWVYIVIVVISMASAAAVGCNRLDAIEQINDDHECRLRTIEETLARIDERTTYIYEVMKGREGG